MKWITPELYDEYFDQKEHGWVDKVYDHSDSTRSRINSLLFHLAWGSPSPLDEIVQEAHADTIAHYLKTHPFLQEEDTAAAIHVSAGKAFYDWGNAYEDLDSLLGLYGETSRNSEDVWRIRNFDDNLEWFHGVPAENRIIEQGSDDWKRNTTRTFQAMGMFPFWPTDLPDFLPAMSLFHKYFQSRGYQICDPESLETFSRIEQHLNLDISSRWSHGILWRCKGNCQDVADRFEGVFWDPSLLEASSGYVSVSDP